MSLTWIQKVLISDGDDYLVNVLLEGRFSTVGDYEDHEFSLRNKWVISLQLTFLSRPKDTRSFLTSVESDKYFRHCASEVSAVRIQDCHRSMEVVTENTEYKNIFYSLYY